MSLIFPQEVLNQITIFLRKCFLQKHGVQLSFLYNFTNPNGESYSQVVTETKKS